MRLPDSNIKTESHGVIDTTSFGISEQNIGILLNILRTKIYKNPILAVCREISCNSRDAHREVHNDPNNPTTEDTPIEIYLPNEVEPTVIFRDFGPGIGPRRKDIFVSFGASTKRQDNVQTGGFGLGCKTPFAYGQSFTVDTVTDAPEHCRQGKKHIRYVYNAYIDETQVGAMDLMSMQPTDDPKGTAIILPVKAHDFKRFTDTIIECTKHWKVKPILKGGDPDVRPSYPEMVELYRGTDWVMYTEGVTYPCAIVDGIEYPIDKMSINCKTDLQREMLDYGFCMEFGVGELSLAASRDHLAYDDATVERILAKVDQISAEIRDKIIDSIASAPSYFEACNMYRAVKNKISGIVSNLGSLKWNDHKLRVTCNVHDIGKWAKVVGYSANGNQVIVERKNDKIYFNDSTVMLIHNDKTTHLNKHVVLWLLQQNEEIKTIQAIYTPDEPSSAAFKEAVEMYGSIDDVTVEYNMELLDLLQPVKYSSIQIPKTKYLPKAEGGSGARVLLEDGNINGYTLYSEYSRRSGRTLKATPSQFPRDDGGIYVLYDYKTKRFTSEGKPIDYGQFTRAHKLVGEDIVGLTKKRAEMVADNPNWVPLQDALRKMFEPLEQKMSGDALKALSNNARFVHKKRMKHYENKQTEIEDKKSPLIVWINLAKETLDAFAEHRNNLELYRWFGHNVQDIGAYGDPPYDEIDADLKKAYEEVGERYPLFHLVSNHQANMAKMIEYINLVDRSHSEDVMEKLLEELSGPSQPAQQVAAL